MSTGDLTQAPAAPVPGAWSHRRDSNPLPPAYKAGAPPGCASMAERRTRTRTRTGARPLPVFWTGSSSGRTSSSDRARIARVPVETVVVREAGVEPVWPWFRATVGAPTSLLALMTTWCSTAKASTARCAWAPEDSHPALSDFTRARRCQRLEPVYALLTGFETRDLRIDSTLRYPAPQAHGRDGRIRTCVVRLPKPVGGQAAPRPVRCTPTSPRRTPSSRSPVQFSRIVERVSPGSEDPAYRLTGSALLERQEGSHPAWATPLPQSG